MIVTDISIFTLLIMSLIVLVANKVANYVNVCREHRNMFTFIGLLADAAGL